MRIKLKRLRQSKGLSQQDMAERMNRSQSAYSRIESGESRLYEDELIALCKVLKCRMEDILDGYEGASPADTVERHAGKADSAHDYLELLQKKNEEFLERITEGFVNALRERPQ